MAQDHCTERIPILDVNTHQQGISSTAKTRLLLHLRSQNAISRVLVREWPRSRRENLSHGSGDGKAERSVVTNSVPRANRPLRSRKALYFVLV